MRGKQRRNIATHLITAGTVILLALVGLALVLWAAFPSFPPSYQEVVGSARQLATPLGQTLLIASLLALTVDRHLKKRFRDEIGRDLYWTIFRKNSPPAYEHELQRFFETTDRVVTHSDWRIRLKVIGDSDEKVQLDVNLQASGANISGKAIGGMDQLYLPCLERGASQVNRYEFFPDPPRPHTQTDEFKHDDLESVKETTRDGTVLYDLSGLESRVSIPSGEGFRFQLEASIVRRLTDIYRLVARSPHLGQRVTLEGPALKDLDIEVWRGDWVLQPETEESDEITYKLEDMLWPGQATMLSWRPKGTDN